MSDRKNLAFFGGEPVRSREWPEWPRVGPQALDSLSSVLRSHRWTVRGWYTGTPSQDQVFADTFACYHQVPYCVLTASGSAALLLALEALDIGYGDEVIVPGLTWMAPAIAVVNVNAVPVLVDVVPETLCLSGDAVEAAVTPRTRCIIVVHHCCTIADMDRILQIAQARHLAVIEDASQAHGAIWRGHKVGTMGDIGVFSMNQEKVLAAGEGGVAITSDPVLYRRMEQLRADGSLFDRTKTVLYEYQSDEPGDVTGTNLCLSEFQAAVMLHGLLEFDKENQSRTKNGLLLNAGLSVINGLFPLRQDSRVTFPTFFKYALRFDRGVFAARPSAVLCRALSLELGLSITPPDPPLHANPLYAPLSKRRHRLGNAYEASLDLSRVHLPEAENAAETTFTFHHRALLGTQEDLDDLILAFEKVRRYAHLLPDSVDESASPSGQA